ncbi:MAG: 50S ribosomal protein L29 [Candidatus Latescibacteria bacterium]|nr:50S ribosomal protein L29 [bacterium]MCB9512946.1 50S ribosomal protein L29 [Candidatus Latescibacterota bacterium]MCB9516393.1 50S ribosomal protein L29 [Candidatus Latescibacterota bacterium]
MKMNEMRDLTLQELEAKEREMAEELFNMKLRHGLGQLDNPLNIRKARRDLARIKSLLSERQQERAQ